MAKYFPRTLGVQNTHLFTLAAMYINSPTTPKETPPLVALAHLDADHQSALDVGPLVQEVQHEQLGALLLGGLGAPMALVHDLQAARREDQYSTHLNLQILRLKTWICNLIWDLQGWGPSIYNLSPVPPVTAPGGP